MAQDNYNLGLRFQAIVRAFPEATAIFADGRSYDFKTLNQFANRLARWLKAHDLRRGGITCLELPKTIEAYALAMACIKLGMPYTFLDSAAPSERARRMLNRCNPALVVSTRDGEDGRVVLGDARQRENFLIQINAFDDDDLHETTQITGTHAAYIMFTSGSTGEPKGAVISHQGVLNLADWARSHLGIGPGDRLTNVNPLHFDNSVFDIYGSLLNGAAIVALDAFRGHPPANLVKSITDSKCTFFFAVPTLFMYLDSMHLLTPDVLPGISRFMFGGEGFPIARLRRFFEAFAGKARLINCYGPTETSCICYSFDITPSILQSKEALAPLGRINPNFSNRILDEEQRPVIPGHVGELWLGGPGVGLGYFNHPEETERKFRQDPLVDEYRSVLYRTGDLVQEDQLTSTLHFRGRTDNQVKLRGYRVELEEIDHALEAIPGVERALAVVIQGSGGASRLIAAYSGGKIQQSELLERCRARLPSYMIPNQFVWFESMPINANGKADRRAAAALLAQGHDSHAALGYR